MFARGSLYLTLSLSMIAAAGLPPDGQADPSPRPSCTGGDRSVSDFDGDGQADAIVGAPTATVDGAKQAGLVTVVYGTKHAFVPERAENLVPGSPGVAGSSKARAAFGEAVDVSFLDADDCADVIIGAPGQKVSRAKGAGAAYVVYGAPGGLGLGKPGLLIRAGSRGVPGKPAKADAFGGVITSNRGLVVNHLVAFGLPVADTGGIENSGAVVVVEFGLDGAPVRKGGALITQDSPGIPDESDALDRFGTAVAIGDPQTEGSLATLFVGTPGEDFGDEHEAGSLTVIDGPTLGVPSAEQWLQGQGPLSDQPEQPDRFGNSVAYGSDPATGQIALLIGSPGEEVITSEPGKADAVVHEAGAAHLLDGCTKLADCTETFLTQGSGPMSDSAEKEDRFGTTLTFAPTRTTQDGLFAILGTPGEKVGKEDNAGMVQMVNTQDHSIVYQAIDESLADIPGEAVTNDRFGDAISPLASSAHGWLGMLVVGVPGKDGGTGVVVTLPFRPPTAADGEDAPPATKPRLWDPGQGAIPPVDFGFGLAIGAMAGVLS